MALTPLEKGNINAAFVDAMLECAQKAGLKQKDLAQAAGIDPGSITKLKNGAKALTVVEFWRISARIPGGWREVLENAEARLANLPGEIPADLWVDYEATIGQHQPDPVRADGKEVTHGHS